MVLLYDPRASEMYTAATDDLDDLCNIVKSRPEAKAVETAMEEDSDFIPTTVLEVQTSESKRADKVRLLQSVIFAL